MQKVQKCDIMCTTNYALSEVNSSYLFCKYLGSKKEMEDLLEGYLLGKVTVPSLPPVEVTSPLPFTERPVATEETEPTPPPKKRRKTNSGKTQVYMPLIYTTTCIHL